MVGLPIYLDVEIVAESLDVKIFASH